MSLFIFDSQISTLLSPKGEFLMNSPCGSHCFKDQSSLVLLFDILSFPLRDPSCLLWRAYLPLKFCSSLKLSFFFCWISLAIGGNDYFFFWYQQGKNRAGRAKMDPNIDTFCILDIHALAILGVEIVTFLTFSKLFLELFRKCLSIILFLTLEGLFLGVFSARKVAKWSGKSKISVTNLLILAVFSGHFWPFWGSKKSFSRLFQSCFADV